MTNVAVPHAGARHARQTWWYGYLLIVCGGLLITGFARRRVAEPFLGVSLALILLLLICWLIRPRATLYALIFLTAVSDTVTVWWFPFAKNLSSRESISYVADALTISPLEIALYLGAAVSCVRRYARTRTFVPRAPLTWPLLVFTGFVVLGFARGISRNGDLRIAVIEGRALFYIVLVFVIVANECDDRSQLRPALWALLAGVVVQSVLSINYLNRLDPVERDTVESLNEHGSVLGQGLLVVAFFALVLLGVKRGATKWMMLAGLIPTVYIAIVGQRRSGIAALVVAGAAIAVVLFWRRRRYFFVVTPILALVLAGYVSAFWNSTSSAAFPAQAIKGIIAPSEVSDADRSSDLYRLTEGYDINFTIRAEPVFGIGFGQAFYRPLPLPQISTFVVEQFVPHNNVLWIWLKMGFGGFVAMFYVFAKAIFLGAGRIRRAPVDIDLVVTTCATAYILMFAVYSYVDMSWDARNTVFLGLALAICGGEESRRNASYEAPASIDTVSSYSHP